MFKEDTVTIVDYLRRMFRYYNTENGKFIRDASFMSTPETCDRYVERFNEIVGAVMVSETSDIRLLFFGKDGSVSGSIKHTDNDFTKPKGIWYSGVEGDFHIYGEDLLYKECYNDTVYTLEQNHCLVPRYVINTGKYASNF